MTRGDEYWMIPVASVILRVMLVPAGRLTTQVYGLAVKLDERVSIDGALVSPPGMIARMKGDVPPLQVICAG